jgi:hypothetical protein
MDEDPLLLHTDKGLTANYKGINLYPPENPLGYARRRAIAAEIQPGTLVFVPSVGLGYGLAELLSRLPEGSAILCVEADQAIMALASSVGLPQDPRLTIVRTESDEAIAIVLSRMGTRRFRRVVSVALTAGYRIAPVFYERIKALLVEEIRTYWQNRMTLIGMGSLWVRNLFENVPLLTGAPGLQSLSTGLPVVVAGAGPTLEAFIPFIRKLRSRILLMCVDTALPVLAGHGITPDLAAALEAQAHNMDDFLPFRDPSMVLSGDLSSFPPALRLFKESLFMYSSAFAPLALFQRMKERGILPCPVPPLGSVGVAAAHAALGMTTREVVCAGLDFSYPGRISHARGSPSHIAALCAGDRLRPSSGAGWRALAERPRLSDRGVDGSAVSTDSVLRSYRDQLARLISRDPDRVLDPRPAGLDLGARRCSLEEAADIISSGEAGERLRVSSRRGVEPAELRDFIQDERMHLSKAVEAAYALMAGEAVPAAPASREAISSVDYAYIHFPDDPDFDRPNRSFMARAVTAFRYYSERLERVLSRIEG